MRLDTHCLETLDQVQEFLAGSQQIDLEPQTRADAYAFVAKTVQRFDYPQQGKADKGLLRRFLARATGPVTGPGHPLVAPTSDHGPDHRPPRRPPAAVPAPLHQSRRRAARRARCAPRHAVRPGCAASSAPAPSTASATAASSVWPPSPTATCITCDARRAINGAAGRCRRRRARCRSPSGNAAARKPFGQPGYVRVDTVHQGDLDGIKGLYHLNLVDEVTQFQFIGSVEHIDAACLVPVLDAPAAGVPVHPPRLPHRQRLRVRQPRSRGAAADAAHRRVHQIPRATLHRQRPGREQERLGRPKASRPRPHPQPLRGAGQRFHPAGPLALPQFPPALLLPQRNRRRQGSHPQALPRR